MTEKTALQYLVEIQYIFNLHTYRGIMHCTGRKERSKDQKQEKKTWKATKSIVERKRMTKLFQGIHRKKMSPSNKVWWLWSLGFTFKGI